LRDLLGLEAVVVAVAVGLMAEAIELGADLADLGQHHFLVAAALVRAGVHEGPFDVHVEAAGAEKRHRRAEYMGQFDHFAGLDEFCRIEDGFGLHQVAGTSLVASAPFRRAADAFCRHRPGRGLCRSWGGGLRVSCRRHRDR
jgi:hypothetical protein